MFRSGVKAQQMLSKSSSWQQRTTLAVPVLATITTTALFFFNQNQQEEALNENRIQSEYSKHKEGVFSNLQNFIHQHSFENFIPSITATKLDDSSTTTLLNWSGTHAVNVPNARYWEPESVEEVEQIVAHCHKYGIPVRPLGSHLSPNGIAFCADGMISMANLDEVISVDPVGMTVTVQAGARVSQVVDALRQHNLTLPNLASIAEQQMGGFIQVGAHGTGSKIAPVDDYVTKLKIVTPGRGTLTLTAADGELFQLAKVGLGCLGVVVEISMQCVPAHELVEQTIVLTRQEAKEHLPVLLNEHKHMRYMWIPYADAVVCVTNHPKDAFDELPSTEPRMSKEEQFKPLTDLLLEVTKDSTVPYTAEMLQGMGFGEIRDALLAVNPLNIEHVKRCNQAEAEFWKNSAGYQIKPSDELLQFDCGGSQWVWEVCFPTGSQDENDGSDMAFMDKLLEGIEKREIPAHTPIEQRWSASSSSLMSPAYGKPKGLHSWVGIINYLPTDEMANPNMEQQRRDITALFKGEYCDLMRDVMQPFNATSHWAKLERPDSMWKLIDLQMFMEKRFPLKKFNEARASLDPKNIMANPLLNLVLGKPN